MKHRLRWRREPSGRGIARIFQGKRGWELMIGKKKVAYVGVLYKRFSSNILGWYWWACVDESDGLGFVASLINTSNRPASTDEECKKLAEAYIRKCIGGA